MNLVEKLKVEIYQICHHEEKIAENAIVCRCSFRVNRVFKQLLKEAVLELEHKVEIEYSVAFKRFAGAL